MSVPHCLALDLGGTNIRAAVARVDRHARVTFVGRDRRTTPATSAEEIVAALVASGRAALASASLRSTDLTAIGCSSPGPLDHRTGVVHTAPNLTGFTDLPLGALLGAAFDHEVFVDRDTSMAAVGEALAGAAIGSRDFVYLTVSTGLGGAVVSGGRMIRGATGTAGELGHWPVALASNAGVPVCGCGAPGCAEAFAGGRNLAERAGRADAAAVFAAAAAGDPLALRLVRDAEEALGALVVGIANVLNPERIVVGGAVAEHQPAHVLAPMRAAIAGRAFGRPAAVLRVVPAALGADVGLVGAALAADARVTGRGEWFL
ncbi:MAG: ROK family protein [Chloroflexi bacterium]|nr:ROK family protein [Chloroflexota bacterium]